MVFTMPMANRRTSTPPPWNANEPENGYAVDNLNGEVDQTDALGLFDDPINDAQWNTVEEYVAAAAAEKPQWMNLNMITKK